MNHRMKTGLLNYYLMMNGVKMKQKYQRTDTMLTATDFLEGNERQDIVCDGAPAEGNVYH